MLEYRSESYPTQNYEVIVDLRACAYIEENIDNIEVGGLYDERRPTGKKIVDCKIEPLLLVNFFEGFKQVKGSKWGKRIDSYTQTKVNPRRMMTTSTSLQGIPRIVRHTICRENMYDFDIVNCHPVLLVCWCDSKGIVCDNIRIFNENRALRFSDVQHVLQCSKDDAKTYILRLTNGGGMTGKKNEDILEKLQILEWFNPFITQLFTIRERVNDIYPELMKKAIKAKGSDYYNLHGVIISYLLTNLENQILQIIVNGCIKKKVKISALIYDGFMAYKESVTNKQELCEYLEKEVVRASGYVIKIVEKEMLEGIVIPEEYLMKTEKEELEKQNEKEEKQRERELKKQEKETFKSYKKEQRELKKQVKEQEVDNDKSDGELADLFLEKNEGSIMYNKNVGYGFFYNHNTRLWLQFNNFDSLSDSVIKLLNIQEAKWLKNVIHMIKCKLMNNEDDVTRFNMVEGLIALDNLYVFDMKIRENRLREKEDYCSFFLKRTYKEYNKEWVNQYIGSLLCPEGKYNQDLINQFMELIGYVFTGENNLKYMLLFIGAGDNGKSLFLECIMNLLEQYAVSGNSKIFKKPRFENDNHEAHLFPLLNKRATFISEMDDKDEFNCKMLKAISGNDSMSIRNSGSPITQTVTLKTVMLIATNVVPRFDDIVFAERLVCVNFPNKFVRDANKASEIKSHLDDLFCAIMDGASRYYQRDRKINLLPVIKNYTTEIKISKDPFSQFILHYNFKKGNKKEYCKDIYQTYVDHLRQNSHIPKGKETFYKEIEKYFHINEKEKDKKGYFYFLSRENEEDE